MKRIIVKHGVRKQIAKSMNCSSAEVSYALNYARENAMSRRIRKVALDQFGGQEIELPSAV